MKLKKTIGYQLITPWMLQQSNSNFKNNHVITATTMDAPAIQTLYLEVRTIFVSSLTDITAYIIKGTID
ncbi:hypothetical protein NUBL21973_37290 [Klebsiella pneumoniae]|nr:hypothetical protein NUBL21973_37290 [Klebsiella pneumoniae]